MSDMRRRRRNITFRSDPSLYVSSTHGTRVGRVSLIGNQITDSEGHPWTYEGFKGEDVGGPFRTERTFFNDNRGDPAKPDQTPSPMISFDRTGWFGHQKFHGPFYPELPSSLPFPSSRESSDAQLDAWGTKAIALCKPTNSVADLSTAIGELIREGLPSMIGMASVESRLRDIRASGDEYLNVVFGWLPLVNDVRKTAYAIRESNKILRQYERDAGRLVRRSYEFPIVREQTDPTFMYNSRGNFGGLSTNSESFNGAAFRDYPGHLKPLFFERKTEIRRWFKGAFTYYLPSGYDSRNGWDRAALAADQVYGISLTPETLWNLTPWSWAADWLGNYGDVLANVSSYLTDGLVLRYGYMMETSLVTDTYTLPGVNLYGQPTKTYTLSLSREVKKRRPATPFGFGLTFDSFSSKQKAILAALGITRLR